MIEHTSTFRRSWSDILDHQANIAAAYIEVYKDIPGSTQSSEETPIETLERLENFSRVEQDLKNELQRDLQFVEQFILEPLKECKTSLKPIHKAMKRRENKKLDYEKYSAHVDTYKKKTNRSKREDNILTKGELDLEGATIAFNAADDYIRELIPPFLEKFSIFLPLILDVLFTAQNTFAACAYTTVSQSAADWGFSLDSDIVSEWESQFMPVKDFAERELVTLRTGNTVRIPMNQMGRETTLMGKITGKGGRKGPPPPPPGPPKGKTGRPSPPRTSTAASIKSKAESVEEEYEAPPPVPVAARPSNGVLASAAAGSNASLSASEAAYRARQQSSRPSFSSQHSDASWIQPASVAVDIATRPNFQPNQNNGTRKPSYNNLPAPNANPPSQSLSNRPPSTSPLPSSNLAAAAAAVATKKKPPPPPPKKKITPKEPDEILTALYDFDGENNGDLSFRTGDRIKVTKKTENMEDWWQGVVVGSDGRERGAVGSFPRNYMK